MKKYFYFGPAKNGAMLMVFECISAEVPTPTQVNTIYQEMVRQAGLGVPRPTHYAALDLVEIESSDDIDDAPLILHAKNGDQTVH